MTDGSPSDWAMNISSFAARWLSLRLGRCSTCTNELFSVSLPVCSVLKRLAEVGDGGAMERSQGSRCACYHA